jgi:hypothetical protein
MIAAHRLVATTAGLAAALLLATPAAAEERPSDDDIFGAPAPAAAPAAPATPATPKGAAPPAVKASPKAPAASSSSSAASDAEPEADARAAELLGAGHRGPDGRIEGTREDPLRVGGLVYLRGAASWYQRPSGTGDVPFSSPSLVDVFLDTRPNDRVRAYVLGRLFYTPTGAWSPIQSELVAVQPVQETRGVLDQAYLNFDLERTVFVTVGKQHVKWGTGRFWNPTDFLHPVRRDPLAQYDDRTGVALVKAHLPWEARGWNLYAVAILEDLAGGATPQVPTRAGQSVALADRIGGGGRAEVLLGPVELAIDAVAQSGHRPRFGLDGSFPLGDLDLHFEVALRNGPDVPRYRQVGDCPAAPCDFSGLYRSVAPKGVQPAAVLGGDWSWKYSDDDSLTVGAEYAYDRSGYTSARIYPALLVATGLNAADHRNGFTPFGLGQSYGAVFVSVPKPGHWNDTTFTLTGLANLSDGSGIVRLDHSVLLNTYLTLETYLAGHLGHRGGEFRFGGNFPNPIQGGVVPVATPVLDAGLALRLKL